MFFTLEETLLIKHLMQLKLAYISLGSKRWGIKCSKRRCYTCSIVVRGDPVAYNAKNVQSTRNKKKINVYKHSPPTGYPQHSVWMKTVQMKSVRQGGIINHSPVPPKKRLAKYYFIKYVCWTRYNFIVFLNINTPDAKRLNSQRHDIQIKCNLKDRDTNISHPCQWKRRQRCDSITSRLHLSTQLIHSPVLLWSLITKWQIARLVIKRSFYLHGDAPFLWQLLASFCPLASLSVPFLPLWNWLCTSPLCWCCSDRKTHPPSAALALSPSLTLIGCLVEVTSPFFSACLPASHPPPVFPPSLCVFWPQLLTCFPPPSCLLPIPPSSAEHNTSYTLA